MLTSLDTLFDLSLCRTKLAREVDNPLSQHGISLADLAILRELLGAPGGKLRRSELAERLGVTPSGVAWVSSLRSSGSGSSTGSRTSAMPGLHSSC